MLRHAVSSKVQGYGVSSAIQISSKFKFNPNPFLQPSCRFRCTTAVIADALLATCLVKYFERSVYQKSCSNILWKKKNNCVDPLSSSKIEIYCIVTRSRCQSSWPRPSELLKCSSNQFTFQSRRQQALQSVRSTVSTIYPSHFSSFQPGPALVQNQQVSCLHCSNAQIFRLCRTCTWTRAFRMFTESRYWKMRYCVFCDRGVIIPASPKCILFLLFSIFSRARFKYRITV